MGEADFASYFLARWPTLVRTLVMLGATPAEADQLARRALARCHPDFDRVSREGDPDVHVYRRVVDTWSRGEPGRDRQGAERGYRHVGAAAVHDPTVADPEARVLLLAAVQRALEEMSPEQRLVVVLRFVAELDVPQVCDVLELSWEDVAARQAEGLALLGPDALLREHL